MPEGRDPFAVDEGRALEALRWAWGDVYVVNVRGGVWEAVRRDGIGGAIEAGIPDDLNRAVREDYVFKPVVPR